MYEAKEALAGLVVARGGGAEALEAVEEQLDEVALRVKHADFGKARGRSGFELMTARMPFARIAARNSIES